MSNNEKNMDQFQPGLKPAVGGSDRRIDVQGKATGRTRYVEDMRMDGMLYAYAVRSPHHHTRLAGIDVTKAEKMPGVVRIFTARDIPGENGLSGYSQEEPVLTPVGDTLRQKGAPIALVAADTLEHAREAGKALEINYEVLPHFFTIEEALDDSAPPLYRSGNILNSYCLAHGDLPAAFSTSEVVIETEYQTSFQEHSTLEREALLAYVDETGRLTVYGGTHEPHWQVGYIAQNLRIDPQRIRVILPPTGGSFGSRQDPWPFVAVGLMAHILKMPVLLPYSRREVFDATPKRHPYHMRMRIGAQANGSLTGIQVRIQANTGGYDSHGYWICNYAVTSSGGPYRWQAVDAQAEAVYTNASKSGQFRGYGTPQSAFALECTLDELAQRLGLDPLELRLMNRLEEGQVSFLGYPVQESLGYVEVLEALRPHYLEFLKTARDYNARGGDLKMGVGLAGMWYRFGKSGSLEIETWAELAKDGHFIVYCSAPDYGQGIETVMLQLAAEALGVDRDQVELVNADTGLTPDSGIQGASRATYFIGSSVMNAVQNLKEQIWTAAAEMIDCEPTALSLEGEWVVGRAEARQRVRLAEVAEELERIGKSRRVKGIFDLSPQFPIESRPEYLPLVTTGAQAALVLVDMQTGQVNVKQVAAAHDVGRAISPRSAEGQIEGAILMGIGTALTEEYVQGVSTGFTDYILPMVYEAPEIKVVLVEKASYHGPLGAKGLGEAAILPTAPAVINAVSRTIGARLRRIPAVPERVLKAICSRRAGS